jgi:hypothetical protein
VIPVGVCSGQQLLQRGGYVRVGIASRFQVCLQQYRFDAAVVLALVPFTEVVVAEAVGPQLVGEQGDHTVLGLSFGARRF